MRNEVFRAWNVSAVREERAILDNLSLSLSEGEALGLFGMSESGKSAVLDVTAGKLGITAGTLYYDEEAFRPGSARPAVVQISTRSSLIPELTVWENMELIQRGRQWRRKAEKKRLETLLALYAQDLRYDSAVACLSRIEICVVELVRAFLLGARLITIDDFSFECPASEYAKICGLIGRLKQEGISFLIAGSHLTPLKQCADQIAFITRGRIVKKIENSPENDAVMGKMMRRMIPDFMLRTVQAEEQLERNDMCTIELLPRSEQAAAFQVHRGRITALVDMDGLLPLNASWKRNAACRIDGREYASMETADVRNKTVLTNFCLVDSLIRTISPVDNLCIGCFDRISRLTLISKSKMKYITGEFAAWSGDERLARRTHCFGLNKIQQIQILLFRLRLQNPHVVFCCMPSFDTNLYTQRMINQQLRELADEGCAVCVLITDVEMMDDFADRYVIVENGGSFSDVSYENIGGIFNNTNANRGGKKK